MKSEFAPYWHRVTIGPIREDTTFEVALFAGGPPQQDPTYYLSIFGGPKSVYVHEIRIGLTNICIAGSLDDLCRITWNVMYGTQLTLRCSSNEAFDALIVQLSNTKTDES